MRQTEPKSRPLCPTMHWFLKIKKLCDSLESDINLLLFIFYGYSEIQHVFDKLAICVVETVELPRS